MRLKTQGLIAIICFLFVLFATGFDSIDEHQSELIKNLDNRYYYPQKSGFHQIEARVTWEKRDFPFEFDPQNENPSAQFHWDAITRKRFFIFTRKNFILSDDQSTLQKFFSRYQTIILPETLENQFGHLPKHIISSSENT